MGRMQPPADTIDAIQSSPSVYQNLFSRHLRTLHGDHLDARTNWVTTASGPLQRPTYTALFYLDGVEMGRGSGPTRDAAKESAAARALARLPRSPSREIDHVQTTNQPSSSSSVSQRPRTQSVPGLSVNVGSNWRVRMAEREAQQQDGGERDREIQPAQPESRETSPIHAAQKIRCVTDPSPPPLYLKAGEGVSESSFPPST